MSQPPRVALPPVNIAIGLVGRVDPSKPLGHQVEVKPPTNTVLLGQIYLAFASPMQALQPLKAVAAQGSGPITLVPMTDRWFCDQCKDCNTALLEVLCRAKGITPNAAGEVSNPPASTGAGMMAQGESGVDNVEATPASPPKLRLVENNNDNSPSQS